MIVLKFFVQVKTCLAKAIVPSHNFCHPASVNRLQTSREFLHHLSHFCWPEMQSFLKTQSLRLCRSNSFWNLCAVHGNAMHWCSQFDVVCFRSIINFHSQNQDVVSMWGFIYVFHEKTQELSLVPRNIEFDSEILQQRYWYHLRIEYNRVEKME